MSTKEKLTPADFQSSMDNMRLLAESANGTTVFPTADTELSDEYRDAVLQYGNQCMQMLLNPELSDLLIENCSYKDHGVTLNSSFWNRGRNIRLRNSEGQPQLYLEIEAVYYQRSSHFRDSVVGEFGECDDNVWVFKEENNRAGFGAMNYRATRIFKAEDLLNNKLLRSFVDGTTRIVKDLSSKLMLEKVGAADEEPVRARIDAFIQANEILQPVLNPKKS